MQYELIAKVGLPIGILLLLCFCVDKFFKILTSREDENKKFVKETTDTNKELLRTNSKFAEQLEKNTEILCEIKNTLKELPEIKRDLTIIKTKINIGE